MTKYSTFNQQEKKETKKTVFNKVVADGGIVEEADKTPEEYNNVVLLGYDKDFGDTFMAWNDNDKDVLIIFFGEKGDEF